MRCLAWCDGIGDRRRAGMGIVIPHLAGRVTSTGGRGQVAHVARDSLCLVALVDEAGGGGGCGGRALGSI